MRRLAISVALIVLVVGGCSGDFRCPEGPRVAIASTVFEKVSHWPSPSLEAPLSFPWNEDVPREIEIDRAAGEITVRYERDGVKVEELWTFDPSILPPVVRP